jgi:hypothetical protein
MVIPLTDVGAVKATEACPLPGVTTPIVGAPGTVAVAAEARVAAFTKKMATKQDLKCVAVEWRAMFIGLFVF